MLSLGSNGSRTKKTPWLTPSGSPGGSGLCPLGTLVRTLCQRDPAEPDSIVASAWGSRASASPGLLIYGMTKPGPWLLPGSRCQPRPEHKKTSPRCWYFLASLFTKLSSLAWCQKCIVGNYKWHLKTQRKIIYIILAFHLRVCQVLLFIFYPQGGAMELCWHRDIDKYIYLW